jgi:hypothetical protein
MDGNVASSYYSLPVLSFNTRYYWKVVATNGYGSASSAVWSFTTRRDEPRDQASVESETYPAGSELNPAASFSKGCRFSQIARQAPSTGGDLGLGLRRRAVRLRQVSRCPT